MRKKDSWSSEFRKKKFYERQAAKKERDYSKKYGNTEEVQLPRTISVMLDLDGTTDNINDEKAKIFFEQLEFIRIKFEADYGTVSISTHYRSGKVMNSVLEVLERNLPETFRLGLNFFYEGTYSYPDKVEIIRHPEFNSNKVETFIRFSESSEVINRWMAIIDDGLDEDVYKKYQNKRRMFFCRPSQDEESLVKNNFMSIASCKKGFDGVIEGLAQYIENIRDLSSDQIKHHQENMITHLSSFELMNKIRNHDYPFLMRYFSEGYADEDDYNNVLKWLLWMEKEDVSDAMLEVVDIILKRCNSDTKEMLLGKVKKIKK